MIKGVERKSFLTKAECADVCSGVMNLMPVWRKIAWPKSRGKAPFYVLGYAAYSCRNSMAGYRRGYESLNPVLWQNFSWVYERLQGLLSARLNARVVFRQDASLPGFHILLAHPIFVKVPNPWHVDFDFELLRWKKSIDTDHVLAFTLPIALPKAGAALDVLDLRYKDVSRYPRARWPSHAARAALKRSYPHRLGRIMLQDGNSFHRIAPFKETPSTDEMRITLQGLAARQGRHWEIYW